MADLAKGAAEFRALSVRLKTAGSGGLRREVDNSISAAVRPLLAEIRAGLPDYMPDGYAAVLAADLQLRTLKAGLAVQVRGTAPTRGTQGRQVATLDAGVLRHPLFGNRKRWYAQVAPTGGMKVGWFTEPAQRSVPQFREAILQAMRAVADRVTRG